MTSIILCGGRAARMGADKASLPFGDETMLARITRVVRNISSDVIIVGRRDQDVTTVFDAVDDLGPLAGIAAGLAASTTDLNLVIACDMPLVRPAVLQRLATSIGDHDACVAIVDGHASVLCGVYRKRIADQVQVLLDSGERRVMPLLDQVKTKRVDAALLRDIDPDLETFISVDTPGKYADALARLTSSNP